MLLFFVRANVRCCVPLRILTGDDFSTREMAEIITDIQPLRGALSPEMKQSRREADHSTSAEDKEQWIYTSIPSYVFMY
jgi:hypothetical protein